VSEPDRNTPLSRTAASAAVAAIGWRYLPGTLTASVLVRSLAQASEAAAAAVAACGHDADAHLRADMRPDRAEVSVQARALNAATGRDVQLAHRVSAALARARARLRQLHVRRVTPASPGAGAGH
jgi:4a-hydroxytetrahydrobiopterin dehydratase